MNLSKYEILLKVVELGNITKTAEYFGYTQSAVSQVIKSLEDELGVVLLLRSRAGLSLTSEGNELITDIKDIVEAKNTLCKHIEQFQELHRGNLRIGAFHSIAANMLPELIHGFNILYPEIKLELMEGDFTELENHLTTGKIDLAFLSIRDIKNFETIPLKEDPLYAILPKNHPMLNTDKLPLNALINEPIIYLDEGNYNDSNVIWKKLAVRPNIKYTCKEDNTIQAMVEKGLGIAILPESTVLRTSYDIEIKETDPLYSRTLGIAVRDKHQLSFAAKEFIKYSKIHFV